MIVSYVDYSPGTLFNIGIWSGSSYGTLLANGVDSTSFDDVTMPIKLIAADSLNIDGPAVLVYGFPENEVSVSAKAGKFGAKLMQRSVFKAKSGGKKYLTVAGHSTCSGPTAEPVKKQVPASFSLTTNPNTNVVTHSNPITLTVTIFDKR